MAEIGQINQQPVAPQQVQEASFQPQFVESPFGQMVPASFPEQFGGRPTGTSRRAIRMQQQWDAQQKQLLDQQRIMQQMQLSQMAESRLQRSQDLEFEKYRLAEDREQRVLDEATRMIDSIRGKMGPDGRWISRPIRPEDDDALDRLDNLAREFKFGGENPAAKEMFSALYSDASRLRESKVSDKIREQQQSRKWLVDQQQEAALYGIDSNQFFKTSIDPETNEETITSVDQLGLSKALGEAKRKEIENKKREVAQANIAKDVKDQANSILEEINKTDAEIRKATFGAQREKTARLRDEFIGNAEFLRSEREILVQRLNSLIPQTGGEVRKFATTAEAEAANLPAGTIVEIGGRRARID